MNFVEMRVESTDAGLRLVGTEMGMEAMPDEINAAVLRRLGLSMVVLGVRPEHLRTDPLDDSGFRLTAKVDVVEFLGNDAHIHLSSGAVELVATVSAREPLAVGDLVTLGTPPWQLHLFNPETGAALVSA